MAAEFQPPSFLLRTSFSNLYSFCYRVFSSEYSSIRIAERGYFRTHGGRVRHHYLDMGAMRREWQLPVVLLMLLLFVQGAKGQASTSADSPLKRHYDEAQQLQSAGKLAEAAHQYRIFIADALGEMALTQAQLGRYEKAAPLFDETLRLAPNSPGLKIRYAQAAFAAKDFLRVQTLCEGILHDYPANSKATAKAHRLLGLVLEKTNREADARQQLEMAVALEPDFEDGYALAIADLDAGDGDGAAKVFAEMIAGLGDTAELHLEIGRAYLNSDFQPKALPELQKSAAMDHQLPGVHYALAMAFLTAGGADSAALARSALDAEAKLSPKDSNVAVQLGRLDLQEHRYDQAGQELQQAISLDPSNPDAFLFLGRLDHETGRDNEAVIALRRSIVLTKDPSYNHYQVQKTHYLFGHVLMELGQTEQGKQEMQLSSALLNESLRHDRGRLLGSADAAQSSGQGIAPTLIAPRLEPENAPAPALASSTDIAEEADFERRLAPAIADSYNNLGAAAATVGQFDDALISFERTFEWNPSLEGLDENWAKVAVLSKHYAEAIAPLTRYLQAHPSDTEKRAELASSEFLCKDYPATLGTLQPMLTAIDTLPQLTFLYAASLVKTGRYDEGASRLLRIRKDEENSSQFHTVMGEAYAGQKNLVSAVAEWEESIRLNSADAAPYRSLAQVELEQGKVAQAAANLKKIVELDSNDAEGHRQLALAYRSLKRNEDADREEHIYQRLRKLD
jgi:tetratricopeptide (TPR) repeat protein